MAALRFIAGILLLLAVIALVYDGTQTATAGHLITTSVGEFWAKLAPASLKATQSAVGRYTHPLVWEVLVRRMLLLPAWLLVCTVGALVAYAGRRRHRINIYAN
jgi:hypothetical protein